MCVNFNLLFFADFFSENEIFEIQNRHEKIFWKKIPLIMNHFMQRLTP